jgi:integrase
MTPQTAVAQTMRHPHHNKLKLIKQANGQSDFWYGEFFHKGVRHRKTLRTTRQSEAFEKADDWYLDFLARERVGVPEERASGPTFRSLVPAALVAMQIADRSASYRKSVGETLKAGSYIDRYFGGLQLAAITRKTWDGYMRWLAVLRTEEGKRPFSRATLHQQKIAVGWVLKEAESQDFIEAAPRFTDRYRPKNRQTQPRVYLNKDEYARLLQGARRHVRDSKALGQRKYDGARELHDYIVFMANTGLRVCECKALRVCDVRIQEEPVWIGAEKKMKEVCVISIVGGKKGPQADCISYLSAPVAFRRILKRRGIPDPQACTEPLFLAHRREGLKTLLRKTNLYLDRFGRRRDSVALRHTYICFRLANNVSPYWVAKNTRTSVEMIERHYAKAMEAASLNVNTTIH